MSKVLMKGNEALAECALRAGCRFFAGYPITPQSEVLEYLSWRMEEVGGDFIQSESELAGINMVLGAASTGARAFTSSSGPGFSLMQEAMSYSSSQDLPIVIANVMREGAGLGDIGASQGDYWQMTRGGGHGDYRNIVYAPASVQETANIMYNAFDIAEKYRNPVLICSDAAVGQMVEAVELPEFVEHDINTYDWPVRGCPKGEKIKTVQNVYFLDADYEAHERDKYALITENEQRWESVCTEDAEIVLVAYGISSRLSKAAIKVARKNGMKLGLIRPITLWPFPQKAFDELGDSVKGFVSVEMSMIGQMVDDIKLATNCAYPVNRFGSMKSMPSTAEIINAAKELLEEVKA